MEFVIIFLGYTYDVSMLVSWKKKRASNIRRETRCLQKSLTQSMNFALAFSASATFLLGCMEESNSIQIDSQEYYESIHSQCKSANEGVSSPAPRIVCIKGKIQRETAADFFSLVDKQAPKFIVLESEGGFLSPAIDIGDYLRGKEITAIVNGICASACAQFIFLAARQKVVLPNGGVFFHGGPIPDQKIREMQLTSAQKESLLQEQVRFKNFYASRNISMDLLSNPPEHVQERLSKGEMVFWTWSKKALENFGVTGLQEYKTDLSSKGTIE